MLKRLFLYFTIALWKSLFFYFLLHIQQKAFVHKVPNFMDAKIMFFTNFEK